MTTAELIAELQKVPGDTEVHFQMEDRCCGDFMELELSFADARAYKIPKNKDDHVVEIRMTALRGFETCIKAGRTKNFIDSLYNEKKD